MLQKLLPYPACALHMTCLRCLIVILLFCHFVVTLQALNELEYPEKLQKLLLTPNREMGVELVVQMDSGEIEVRSRMCYMTCYGMLYLSSPCLLFL
jgi:hypothetical protein